MPKPSESFGKNVKVALGTRTQGWLAVESGLTAAMVSDYINGKTFPNLKTAERIAEALGTPLVELLSHEPPKVRPRSLDSLRLEAITLIAKADMVDVTGALIVLKGEPRP